MSERTSANSFSHGGGLALTHIILWCKSVGVKFFGVNGMENEQNLVPFGKNMNQ